MRRPCWAMPSTMPSTHAESPEVASWNCFPSAPSATGSRTAKRPILWGKVVSKRLVLVETTGKAPTAKPKVNFNRSREYWIGWSVAYYQWFSGRKFSDIFKVLSFEDLERMYAPLHEADISKFADIADAKVREHFADTNLKRIRTLYGCTQAELARRSNVSLRSIQMYEQRNKDINKASAETVLSLAKVLGCTMEDLLEK